MSCLFQIEAHGGWVFYKMNNNERYTKCNIIF